MQDLSALAKGSLSMGSSMAGGNGVSEIPDFGAPGTPSEQTSDLPWAPTHNDPEPVIPMTPASHVNTKKNESGAFRMTPHNWKEVP